MRSGLKRIQQTYARGLLEGSAGAWAGASELFDDFASRELGGERGLRDAAAWSRQWESLGAAGLSESEAGAEALEPCLSEEQILAFVDGHLTRPQIAQVDGHLGSCVTCNAVVLAALPPCGGPAPGRGTLLRRCLTFEAGTTVANRYLIRSVLGQGGMGEVYEAFDLNLAERVALKTVVAAGCDNPVATSRLWSEVRLARRVRHPNVCRVHDVGVHEDSRPKGAQLSFISMELIEGEVLARRLRRGKLDAATVLVLAHELLQGLAAIHAAGVVHRDIKSHNVMLRAASGGLRVSIIDFGLAIEATAASPQSSLLSFEGSPHYMAPEQLQGLAITCAADVFACGVVLFEALTGRLPFRSPRVAGGLALRRDPEELPRRARDLASDVPVWLDEFIAHCLTPEPERRFADAARALESLVQHPA